MKRFALVGNPNCGKTTLFNNLTGSTAHVGNWPGVTVDKKDGVYKKLVEEISIIDLPGIYSLSPYTPEEVISRNYILDEKPECVINIIDATNLERNLYLTTQLLEIDIPVVIALNMIDTLEKNGDKIDPLILEKEIGVPVVSISALKNEGTEKLMEVAYEEVNKKRKAYSVLEESELNHLIGDVLISFEALKVDNPLFHTIKLIENDELEIKNHEDLIVTVDKFKATFKDSVFDNDLEAVVADLRYKYITSNYVKCLKRNPNLKLNGETKSDKIDKIMTNKWLGIPIFLVILFMVFHFTFSENLFFLGGLFKNISPSFEGKMFEGLFWTDAGINSPGVILFNLVDILTSSISDVAVGWLEGAKPWVSGLIVDGVLSGIFSVLSFVPQILLLFLFFSILEDSGYMARVAFILDRIFKKFGLSGRAFMPMIMGFGCSVPAMINTRTLQTERERTMTIRVIPFFSCGAKLPILTAIAGAIVQQFNIGNADIITYSMYLLGILTAIITIILMNLTTKRGESAPFIMELPQYHMPQANALMIHLWDKFKHYIQKAFTIILASTIVIWVISHFSFSWEFLEDNEVNKSILASIGMLFQPLFTPLGFGSQLNSTGWVFIVAAITGLIAKENVVATFGTLAACLTLGLFEADEALEGIDAVMQMITSTGITVPALIAFIAFNMTTIPCFAAVATARGEMGKKGFAKTLLFWIVTSYIVSMAIYLVGSFWWTIFIFVGLLALIITLAVLYNSKRDLCKR